MIQQRTDTTGTTTHPVPEGYHTVAASVTCEDASREIDFLIRALGAQEHYRMVDPDTKKISHAEIKIGDSAFMLGDAGIMAGCGSPPRQLGGSPVSFFLYVPDVDALFEQARRAGAKVKHEVMDMFWGDRAGTFECPEGYSWTLASHVRDLSPDEIEKGYADFKKKMAGAKRSQ